jgi:hypothetical protein
MLQWVLVEGPAPGDAHFLGQWLLAAAQVDKLLQEQFERDPTFKLTIGRIELIRICVLANSHQVHRTFDEGFLPRFHCQFSTCGERHSR